MIAMAGFASSMLLADEDRSLAAVLTGEPTVVGCSLALRVKMVRLVAGLPLLGEVPGDDGNASMVVFRKAGSVMGLGLVGISVSAFISSFRCNSRVLLRSRTGLAATGGGALACCSNMARRLRTSLMVPESTNWPCLPVTVGLTNSVGCVNRV